MIRPSRAPRAVFQGHTRLHSAWLRTELGLIWSPLLSSHMDRRIQTSSILCGNPTCAFFQIYFGTKQSGGPLFHFTGTSGRPFVVSYGNDMTLEFRTGSNIHQNFIGFRASLYFVFGMLVLKKLFILVLILNLFSFCSFPSCIYSTLFSATVFHCLEGHWIWLKMSLKTLGRLVVKTWSVVIVTFKQLICKLLELGVYVDITVYLLLMLIIQGQIWGDDTPSLREKKIYYKEYHVSGYTAVQPMRWFDHGLTFATNYNSYNYFNETFIMQ